MVYIEGKMKVTKEHIEKIKELKDSQDYTYEKISKDLGLSTATIFKYYKNPFTPIPKPKPKLPKPKPKTYFKKIQCQDCGRYFLGVSRGLCYNCAINRQRKKLVFIDKGKQIK